MRTSTSSRRGAALVMAVAMVITLVAVAFTLSSLTVGRLREQQTRQVDVTLLSATESAANETVAWMQFAPGVMDYLRQMPVTTGLPDPIDRNYYPSDLAAQSGGVAFVLATTQLPASITSQAFPALTVGTGASPGNGPGQRNFCAVESRIIKLRNTAAGGTFPDGNERFAVFTTGTRGTGAERRRYRIAAVITVNAIVNRAFARAMFSQSGYNVKGTATTDSWRSTFAIGSTVAGTAGNGRLVLDGDHRAYFPACSPQPALADTARRFLIDSGLNAGSYSVRGISYDAATNQTTIIPWEAVPATTTVGQETAAAKLTYDQALTAVRTTSGDASREWVNNQGDIASNQWIDVLKPENIHGAIEQYVDYPVNPVIYNPPTTATTLSSITNNWSYTNTGTTDLRVPKISTGNNKTIAISGSGKLRLWVDGQIDMGSFVFGAGSTVKVELYQNQYTLTGNNDTTLGNSQSVVGDPSNPSRLMIFTNYNGTSNSFGSNNEMSLNGGASWSAILYAPYAGIKLNGGSEFFGSIVSKDFSTTVNGNFSFHFDESLRSLQVGAATPRLTATAWFPRNLTFGEP